MTPEQIAQLIENVIFGFPNFFGFMVLSYVQWRIISTQHKLLERVLDDCLDKSG